MDLSAKPDARSFAALVRTEDGKGPRRRDRNTDQHAFDCRAHFPRRVHDLKGVRTNPANGHAHLDWALSSLYNEGHISYGRGDSQDDSAPTAAPETFKQEHERRAAMAAGAMNPKALAIEEPRCGGTGRAAPTGAAPPPPRREEAARDRGIATAGGGRRLREKRNVPTLS